MGAIGAYTLVLHCHVPYARLTGSWSQGEERLHEILTDTYIPLLNSLYDLRAEGIPYRLTISISPILAEQLASQQVLDNLDNYIDNRIRAAKNDLAYFAEHSFGDSDTPDPHLEYLAAWYQDYYEQIKNSFHERYNRDLIGAFKQLQDAGYIEIMTSVATYAYLPLLKYDSSIRAQLKAGITAHKRLFGKKPASVWLPGCGYRPGLDKLLEEQGLQVFLAETHAFTGGEPSGIAAGTVIGPYSNIAKRYVIPQAPTSPGRNASTYRAYRIARSNGARSDIVVLGRDKATTQQVWSTEWGYPGDFDYREPNKQSGTSGLRYWRVTGANYNVAHKEYYHPDWAEFKIDQHAEHFAHFVNDLLRLYNRDTGRFGILTSSFAVDLFGHWWFEGTQWLTKILRHMTTIPELELTTVSEYVSENMPHKSIDLPESSWGAGGEHFTWKNGETSWMWDAVHDAETRLRALVAQHPDATGDAEFVLNQIARECLLMQASDWPYMITTVQSREYAVHRFSRHAERFNRLVTSMENGKPDRQTAEQYQEIDMVFPQIDYRWFGE